MERQCVSCSPTQSQAKTPPEPAVGLGASLGMGETAPAPHTQGQHSQCGSSRKASGWLSWEA